MSKSNKNILFIMTGSIACYKACSAISALHQKGHVVKVVMSPSSLEFVGAATIEGLTGIPPITDMYAAGHVMDHIHLIRWADLVLVAPATANYINKIAVGMGDDLLTTLFLVHDFKKPFLIAPAMNTMMYLHPTVHKSIGLLKSYGVEILETASGVLACGEIGSGKLLDPKLIVKDVEARLENSSSEISSIKSEIKKEKISVLITGGGTSEAIDDVRVITNKSTGKTAAYLADQFINSGLEVHFLHAKNSALPKSNCQKSEFISYGDLQKQLNLILKQQPFDWVLQLAAVSDYSVESSAGKLSSEPEFIDLKLRRNKKLISEIKKISPSTKLIGFKLTSATEVLAITKKVENLFIESHCDFVIQNDWQDRQSGRDHFSFYYPNLLFDEISTLQDLSFKLFQTINQQGAL